MDQVIEKRIKKYTLLEITSDSILAKMFLKPAFEEKVLIKGFFNALVFHE